VTILVALAIPGAAHIGGFDFQAGILPAVDGVCAWSGASVLRIMRGFPLSMAAF